MSTLNCDILTIFIITIHPIGLVVVNWLTNTTPLLDEG